MNKKLKAFILNSGGSAAAFAPTDIAGLRAWYDGSDLATITKDGSNNVTDLADKSGQGNNLTQVFPGVYTTNVQNGKSGIVFTVLQSMIGPRITALQNKSGVSMFIVCKRGAIAHAVDSSTRTDLFHFVDDGIYSVIGVGSTDYGTVASSNAFHYSSSIFNGTLSTNANRLKIRIGGVDQVLSFTGTIPAATENDASSIIQIMQIGATFTGGTFCEALFYDTALSTVNRNSVESYLATKWGL